MSQFRLPHVPVFVFRGYRISQQQCNCIWTLSPLPLNSVAGNASLSYYKYSFSLSHVIWDSCGHLGGRPRCITVCCRGVQSPAFLGQFCPTISIKLSTAKVRQFHKCGEIRGHESPRVGTPKGIYSVSVAQAQVQGTGHQRHIFTIISGEVRRSKNPG